MSAFAADPLTSAKELRAESQQEAAASQKKIDAVSEETRTLLEEYRDIIQRTDTVRSYNDHLAQLIEDQNEQLTSIQRQIENAQQTQQEIVPLITRMVEVLEELIILDVPFLLEERRLRVQHLQELIEDPTVPLPEKYRRVTEAFQIEMDYGRNIEAYTGELEQGDQTRTVEFLRIGRIALLYRSFDGQDVGYWDQAEKKWVALPASFNGAITKGLRIAKKEAPPDLFTVPVQAPDSVQ